MFLYEIYSLPFIKNIFFIFFESHLKTFDFLMLKHEACKATCEAHIILIDFLALFADNMAALSTPYDLSLDIKRESIEYSNNISSIFWESLRIFFTNFRIINEYV